MPKSNALLGKDVPFVQAYHVGPKQRPTAIYLRTSFTTGDKGAALAIAKAWHNPYNKIDSCHYVIDEVQTIQCVQDKWSSKSTSTVTGKNAITINVCYNPPEVPSDRVVYHTAKQVARLCRLHRIRLRLLSVEEEMRWLDFPWRHRGGIVVATVGDFPTNYFFDSVKTEYKKFD